MGMSSFVTTLTIQVTTTTTTTTITPPPPPPPLLPTTTQVNLEAWSQGKEFGDLRFVVGSRVECRIGEDPVTGWAAGAVVQLMYREANWPEGVCAPYQVQLDDERLIFAPHDIDQVIRAEQGGGGGGE